MSNAWKNGPQDPPFVIADPQGGRCITFDPDDKLGSMYMLDHDFKGCVTMAVSKEVIPESGCVLLDGQKVPHVVKKIQIMSGFEVFMLGVQLAGRLVDYGIFILQCGDPTATGTGGPGYTIPDELDPAPTYPAGTVAMAKRQPPDTGGSQFFLVWADTPLPPEYTVFGTMDQEGLDVVAGIAAQGVDGTDQTSPNAEARIESVTLG